MPANNNNTKLKEQYERDGFLSPVRLIDSNDARQHRDQLEKAEAQHGNLHYMAKIHTLMCSPFELATLPAALDIVEQCIGPDILLYNVTYIIKEANSQAHVSWHQDLTYWGLSSDEQVSMWLALSPATEKSGCMRMLPGSHTTGMVKHHATEDKNNVLLQGQTVDGVSDDDAVLCPLQPGEASFHHGWTLHHSLPNLSDDRRIGLNMQYIAPHVRQTKHDLDTSMLVRGKDKYKHFDEDKAATTDFEPSAIALHKELQTRYEETAGSS